MYCNRNKKFRDLIECLWISYIGEAVIVLSCVSMRGCVQGNE